MQTKALKFKPTDTVRFVRTSEGASGEVVLNNSSARDHVVFKVKTNAAEHYMVRPHIGIVPPGQDLTISFIVKQASMEYFMDAIRKQRHAGGTVFMVLEWPLASETFDAICLQVTDLHGSLAEILSSAKSKGRGGTSSEVLSNVWKSNEAAYKAAMIANKFGMMLAEDMIEEDGVQNYTQQSITETVGGDPSDVYSASKPHRGASANAHSGAETVGGDPSDIYSASKLRRGAAVQDPGAGEEYSSDAAARRPVSIGLASQQAAFSGSASGSTGLPRAASQAWGSSAGRAGQEGSALGVREGDGDREALKYSSYTDLGVGALGGAGATASPANAAIAAAGQAGDTPSAQQARQSLPMLEAKAMRANASQMAMLGLDTLAERQALARVVQVKEIALQEKEDTIRALEEEIASLRTVTGGVRSRRRAAAESDSALREAGTGTGQDEDNEDDSTIKGSDEGGFPLWQLLLLAILAFLLGRLSVSQLPSLAGAA